MDEPTPPDAAELAQRWHDEADHRGSPWWSTCWCCCPGCDPDWAGENPHFSAAMARLWGGPAG